MAGQKLDYLPAWRLFFSGTFFNICLPTSIGGDVVRIVGMGRRTQRLGPALASVFMDRNVGMAALLALGLVSALLVPSTIQATLRFLSSDPLVLPLWPLFLLLLLGFALANFLVFRQEPFSWLDRLLLRRLPERLRGKLERLHAALQAYRLPLPRLTLVFGVALLYQASEVLLVYVLALGLGLALPFWVFGAMVTFQAAAGLLPITINNLGVRDAVFLAVLIGHLTRQGRPLEEIKVQAGALALCYLGVIILSGLAGGLVYAVSGLPKPTREEVRAAETAEAPPAASAGAVPQARNPQA
jgi:hypothetical protein